MKTNRKIDFFSFKGTLLQPLMFTLCLGPSFVVAYFLKYKLGLLQFYTNSYDNSITVYDKNNTQTGGLINIGVGVISFFQI